MKSSNFTRPRYHSFFAAAFSVAWLAHFNAPSASAANRFWSANGTTASGNGLWDTTTLNRWGTVSSGPYTLAWVNGVDVAVLGSVAASSLTLGANITCGGITAQANNSGSGNINESAGLFTLTLGVTGNNVFSGFQSTTAGRPLHINAVIAGASGANLVLTGPSTTGGQIAAMSLNRANTFVGGTSFSGNSSGAVNLTLGHQLALQNSTLTLSTSCNTLAFNSTVAANAFTFGGLAGSGRNLALQNNAGVPAAIALSVGNNNANTTYAAALSGSGSLIKIGTGTLTLSGSNTFSGTTTISGGKLQGVVDGGCVNSKVIIDNTLASLAISITDNTKTWTCKELAPTAAGAIEFDFGAITPSTSFSPLTITGLADFTTATPDVKVNVATELPTGTYPLMTWGSTSGTAPSTPDLTVLPLAPQTAASLSLSPDGLTLNLVITSTAVSVVKADNATNLSNGLSWVGGSAPGTDSLATWNSTVASANTTTLGADLTWAGITIENPNGPVTINGANTLTLGSAAVDINLSTTPVTPADLTLNCPLALGDANSWDVAASRTLSLGGQVSGAFGVTKLGAGTAILSSAANSYSGNTTVSAGALKLGASNVIPNGTATGNVSVAGTLDLNGQSETVNGLSGNGIVDNLATATTSTLTVGSNDQTSTFSGVLRNSGSTATLNLTKTGTGALTLSGANNFTGTTSVTGGALILGHASALGGTSGITLADGTSLTPGISTININKPITLGTTGTTATITAPNVAGSGTTNFPVTVSGGISGDGNVNFSGVSATNGYGVINLNAASNYAGSTLITTISAYGGGPPNNAMIFVNLGVANALPVTTVVTLDGGDGGGSAPGRYCELDLNGKNQTLAGLTNVTGRVSRVQRVVNNSATAATLTINNAADYTYSGQLGWVSGYGSTAYNNLGLAKSGTGIFTVSGSRTYTGSTTVTGGTLSLGTANPNNDSSSVTIGASGILQLTFTGSDTVDKLFINGIQQPAGTYGHSSTGATNGGGGSLDTWFAAGTGTLMVTSGPGYASWQSANGPTTQTLDLDHDNDGVPNGVEYFLGGNTNTTGFTALPAVVNTGGTLSITWTKAASYTGAYGTDFWVETSATLANPWTNQSADPTPGFTVTFPSANEVKYTFPAGTRNFARLKVTGP